MSARVCFSRVVEGSRSGTRDAWVASPKPTLVGVIAQQDAFNPGQRPEQLSNLFFAFPRETYVAQSDPCAKLSQLGISLAPRTSTLVLLVRTKTAVNSGDNQEYRPE